MAKLTAYDIELARTADGAKMLLRLPDQSTYLFENDEEAIKACEKIVGITIETAKSLLAKLAKVLPKE